MVRAEETACGIRIAGKGGKGKMGFVYGLSVPGSPSSALSSLPILRYELGMRSLYPVLSIILSMIVLPTNANAHQFAVIFEATLGPDNRVDSLKVSKVIDPASGSLDAVHVPVPESYVNAARKQLRLRTYPPQSVPFFTWLVFDPDRPEDAAIEPEERPTQ